MRERPRWKRVEDIGFPGDIFPDLLNEEVEEEEEDEPIFIVEIAPGLEIRGPSRKGDRGPSPGKYLRPWAGQDGDLMRTLEHYRVPGLYGVLRRSLLIHCDRMRRDPRCSAMARDLIREELTGS